MALRTVQLRRGFGVFRTEIPHYPGSKLATKHDTKYRKRGHTHEAVTRISLCFIHVSGSSLQIVAKSRDDTCPGHSNPRRLGLLLPVLRLACNVCAHSRCGVSSHPARDPVSEEGPLQVAIPSVRAVSLGLNVPNPEEGRGSPGSPTSHGLSCKRSGCSSPGLQCPAPGGSSSQRVPQLAGKDPSRGQGQL